jgi:plasmid stability protein
MSEDLLRKLQLLEEDYVRQPLVVQQADLQEINQIRSRLGMPLVDARLNEIAGASVGEDVAEAKPEPEEVQDHTEAREIYQAYLKKIEDLEMHRAYADQVAEATAGQGQTPVRPLATMGTNGGPLLCDHCGKPIVLEGGRFHGVAADVAWKQNPRGNWTSWILGGMVVEIQTNGTLRIYHGYPGRNDQQCCNVASREDANARATFNSSKRSEKRDILRAFLQHELPDMTREERLDLLSKILDTMYSYDPGLGINRPGKES